MAQRIESTALVVLILVATGQGCATTSGSPPRQEVITLRKTAHPRSASRPVAPLQTAAQTVAQQAVAKQEDELPAMQAPIAVEEADDAQQHVPRHHRLAKFRRHPGSAGQPAHVAEAPASVAEDSVAQVAFTTEAFDQPVANVPDPPEQIQATARLIAPIDANPSRAATEPTTKRATGTISFASQLSSRQHQPAIKLDPASEAALALFHFGKETADN